MIRRGWCWFALIALAASSGCAHSEEEWQAQLRTVGDLKTRSDAAEAQAKKARADLDEATARAEQLRQQLRTAGVDVAHLDADLDAQARATEEHRRRAEQIAAAKRGFDRLRTKLAALSKQGVAVTVHEGRITIRIGDDTLFEGRRDALTRGGREALLHVAEVIRGDPSLSTRSYQLRVHADGAARGGPFKDALGLAAMRAREAVTLLVERANKGGGGLDAHRWSAAAYGDAVPDHAHDDVDRRGGAGTAGASPPAGRGCEIVLVPAPEEELDLRSLSP